MSAKVTLTVTEGQLTGTEYLFDSRNTCIVGRHPDCTIQLPNDQYHGGISRYHCLLDINPPDIRIRDFGSLHGTFVNGECIGKRNEKQTPSAGRNIELAEYNLQDGDEIRLANTTFKVSVENKSLVTSTWIIPPEIDPNLPSRVVSNLDGDLGSIKGYSKIRLLGKGGFGKVYLACFQDKTGTKLVALKILLPQVAVMPQMKARFLGEVERTKMLDHPNLISFDDYGEADGIFFFTMEYCDRGSVADLLKKRGGKLAATEAIDIILQVLDGLHYAHIAKGLVHRDIKPANIFLTVNKGKIVAKLGDYGLAKAFDMAGLSGQTVTGTAMGTPHFMPRQQVLEFKYAKPDVDIWAVAATLYFMLTGTHPRNLTNKANPMLEILTQPSVPIRERESSIPVSLAKLIDYALIDKPELNFKSAIAFKQALLTISKSILNV
ncbi:MAG: protein kinase [Cyanobacteria bacterium P01_G01_bin.39]